MDYASKRKKRQQDSIKQYFTTETPATQVNLVQLGYYALLACILNSKLTSDECFRLMNIKILEGFEGDLSI